ncbi:MULTISPECIES: hypothetical protein [Myroides]|uniref:hypothetical protein n=1 Tax=Myroides TaxID=76831 RepID=UPI000280AACA|nr:hypothetical protein [Myroides odoratimimus]EKB05260.1 hypothetical protein HMPREF9711_01395 [Myroides odoratimimus CCUG 3837]
MKKYYYLMIACLSLLTLQAQQTKNGSYEYPLTDIDYNNLPSWIANDFGKGTLSGPTGQSRYTSEGIVLTIKRATTSAFAITDLNLDLRKGAKFEFEYAMASVNWNDAQGAQYGGGGMTFFLFDAKEKLSMGYVASALGYSFNGSTAGGSTAIKTGLGGAYLGIGFDLDGNNKERKGFGMQSYETREGLTEQRYKDAGFTDPYIDYDFGRNIFGTYYKNHITLRGAGQGNGYKGNPLLLTKYFGGQNAVNEVAMATLDYNTGDYNFSGSYEGDDFNIADGGADYSPKFQKIEVELRPDGEEGMYVTIKGNGNVLIDNFYYKHSFKTYGDGKVVNNKYEDYQYNYNTRIPDRVNIGFAATTMDLNTQKTIIRNVKVSPIDDNGGGDEEFTLEERVEELCVSDSGNSNGASIELELSDSNEYNLDKDTFEFTDEHGNYLGGSSYNQSGVGKWEYSSYYNEVTLTISDDDFEPGDKAEVYYTIEGDNRSNGKRGKSRPTAITIDGIACGAIANPQISTKSNQ